VDPVVVLFGLGVGILVGLTGIGGGSLMTPLLVLFAGVQPVVAIGTDLAYGAITKSVGGWRLLRRGAVDLGISTWLALGSVPGSLFGVWLIHVLHRRFGKDLDTILLIGIAVALIVVAGSIIVRALFMPKLVARERHSVPLTRRTKTTAVLLGLVLGLFVGMTSVGSGALIGLVLILIFHLTPHRVVGTDVFHAAVLLWAAGLAHWVGGNVDFGLMANILAGSIPGILIGTALLPRVPSTGLRPALGCVLLGSALGVLSKAGAHIPGWAIVAAPIAVGAVAYVVHRLRTPTPAEAVAA
jgi:uncharacterized membrane protein YfcA